MTVVVDASVVVAGLASADATGQWAESVLAGEPLAAPHHMPVEAASILHRAELAREISADAASLAHADLRRLRVEYFPYDPFAERIWELRSPGLGAPPGSPERARLFLPPGPASSGTGNPVEMPGLVELEQVELLRRVRRDVADCDTARKRVELQIAALAESSGELERRAGQARAALEAASQRLQRLQAKIDARRSQEQAGERTCYPGLTSYEAWYVALAEFLGVKLATLDTRLAFVPGPRCGFCLPPPPPA